MKTFLFFTIGLFAFSGISFANALPSGPYVELADCHTLKPVNGPTTNHVEVFLIPSSLSNALVLYDVGGKLGQTLFTAKLKISDSSTRGTNLSLTLNENYGESIFVSGVRGQSGSVRLTLKKSGKLISYKLSCINHWAK